MRRLDITDQIYGRLQAIVTDWYKTKETGLTHWFCQCEDNNIVSVYLGDLRNGHTKSCGCLKSEKSSERMYKMAKNQRGENNSNYKGKVVIFCKWCGKEKEVWPYEENTAQFCNKKCQGKWESKNRKGEDGPNWKGGITSLYMQIRNSIEYREFIQTILKKVNYTCQLSKEKISGDLQVHHIKGFAKILKENNIITLKEALKCKELWDEKNVVVLSEKWHSGIKIYNSLAFHRLYGNFNFTEEDFYTWFNEFKIEKKLE